MQILENEIVAHHGFATLRCCHVSNGPFIVFFFTFFRFDSHFHDFLF
jgi:hypothetical protein